MPPPRRLFGLVVLTLLIISSVPFGFADGSTLSVNPTATTNGAYPWTNPSDGYTSNNQYATAVATLPTYRATGAMAHGTTSAITVALPAGMSDKDIVILVASTITGGSITITTNGSITAWTAVSGSPIDVASGEKLYVWWGRYSSGSTGVSITPGGDHIVGRTVAYSSCYAGGSPVDVAATGTEAGSDTSFSFVTGLTTTYNNEMIIFACSTGYDPTSDSTAQFGTWTGANLGTKTERMDNDVNEGGGGGFGLCQAPLVAAGAVGTVGATLANASPKSYITFALISTAPGNAFDQIYGTFGITGAGGITKVELGYEAYSSVAEKLDFYTSSSGGAKGAWNAVHTTANLGTSDPGAYTYIDVSADVAWTWTLLNDANFKVKVVTNWVSGTPTWSVDALVVRVSYNGYTRAVTKSFSVADSATRRMSDLRSAAKAFTLTKTGTRLLSVSRGVSAAFTLSESGAKLLGLVRGASESLKFTNVATRMMVALRAIAVGITVAEGAGRVLAVMRGAAQSLTVSSAGSSVFGWVRSVTRGFTFSDGAARFVEYLRDAAQGVSVTQGGVAYLAIKYVVGVAQSIVVKSFGVGFLNMPTGGISYWLIIVGVVALVFFMLIRRR